MPTYEYKCNKCGYKFEEFQNITEPPLRRCPRCKGKVRRLIGKGAGIIFKGSGFYQTDYRSPSYREQARKEKEKLAGTSSEKAKDRDGSKTEKTTGKSKKEQNA